MSAPKLQPALLGGLFTGVLSALPFVNLANYCCCLWVLAGGMLAAYIMQQNHPLPVTAGDGAAVGFLTGIVAVVVALAVAVPIRLFIIPLVPGLALGAGSWRPRRDMPPEVRDLMRGVGPYVMAVIGAIVGLIVDLIFSTLGGVFGALLFRTSTPPPAAPPPPPSHPPVMPPAGPPVESWSYPDQDRTPE